MGDKLSEDDVKALLTDPSAANRERTANKISGQVAAGDLSGAELTLAEDIFRIMVKDAEVRVRQALADNLKESPLVSRDVAMALANDVDDVALPMIAFSEVLTENDLISIVKTSGESKQMAVASRSRVQSSVADALVDAGTENVVARLVSNAGADITEATLTKVVDKYGDNVTVNTPLSYRENLPITVVERLLTKVSESLREHLAKTHDIPDDVVNSLLAQSRERATIGLSAQASDKEVESLVHHLYWNGRLTPSLVVRAAVMGDMRFMEHSLASLAKLPVDNARMLIHDGGKRGLRAIYEKAKLPASYYPAIRIAIDVAAETELDGEDHDLDRYHRRMIERVLTQYEDLGVDFESGDLEYLLAKMSELPSTHIAPH